MNEDGFSHNDLFSPTALDEATELRALSQAVKLSQGFKLIFARCNQIEQQNTLIARLRTELTSFNLQEIHFSESLTHLLDGLRSRVNRPEPDAVLVSGLEYSLPNAEDAQNTPFIANLNASRNSFPAVINCPLVVWLPEYVLNAITIGAPDFFSIRSGVYFFAAGPGETADLADNLTVGGTWQLLSMTDEERQERVKTIKSLLSDYQSLPKERRDEITEMRLRLRLGHLLTISQSYDSAKVYYQQLLDQAQRLGDRMGESAAYGGLGIIHLVHEEFARAEECFKRNLEIAREINDRFNEAMALRNLGNIYTATNDLEKAQVAYEQSLVILRELDNRAEEGTQLFNIGMVFLRQDKLTEAEKYLEQAIEIARQVNNLDLERSTLLGLGVIQRRQGRLLEAEGAFNQSIQLARRLGQKQAEWRPLQNLSRLREEQGDLKGALDLQRRTVEILDSLNAKELDTARRRLASLARKASAQHGDHAQSA
jgi:tetratricopeptide (TPR) repeat protein